MPNPSNVLRRNLKQSWAAKLRNSGDNLARLVRMNRRDLAILLHDHAKQYRRFTILKPSGEPREICAASSELLLCQRRLNALLYRAYRFPPYLHGGIQNRSIRTFVEPHVQRQMVATLDVRNFFPSVTVRKVLTVFETMGLTGSALKEAIQLVMLDGSLPQGAASSALLANLAFLPVDAKLRSLCKKKSLTYGRFVDDIAMSADHDFQDLRGPFKRIIEQDGYHIADEKKILFMARSQRQVVTGLVVNERIRPTKAYIDAVEADVAICVQGGIELLAALEGMSPRKVKLRLNGKVRFIAQFDEAIGRRLSGKLYNVDWTACHA